MAKSRHFSRTQHQLGTKAWTTNESSLEPSINPGLTLAEASFEPEVLCQPAWASVRPEKLERARRLVADADYPPVEVLQSVAGLLAKHLAEGK